MWLRRPMCRSTTTRAPICLAGQRLERHRQLLDDVVVGLDAAQVPEERVFPEVHQRPADVGLEQHDGREDDVADDVADQPGDGLETERPRRVEQPDDGADGHRHLRRARAAYQLEQLVDDDGDNGDVEQIPSGDGWPRQQGVEPGHGQGGARGPGLGAGLLDPAAFHVVPNAGPYRVSVPCSRIISAARTTCTISATA